ncbi:pre-mRNA-splicing factor ATP-dependent RNA helicase prp22 [Verticillium alfalfae VaMs.102]|uniref:RNA helicase n=1 Tax=Verticillium alfalfae (strain VaMs.102 / ATCC MYA-4576 / FGSC 10136) TaxID=526221 RepID=C9SGR0_VERA1|nr:pre-mRNA-splicing factor ATP-dependent RNA helicase prp22 [Verticillium alfalfae VaMs.102]EEY17555.1 pre-mRNA-splicing factor ATP-dependent RNA helicase prp22 [Verticillium alfalfae VaMs.102]
MADFDVNSAFIPALHKPAALLPIAKHREGLLYLIETKPVTIIVGQTGSGKTTQIPQFLEASGWADGGKVIGVTQPRRVAATTVALRVAEEVGCEVGKEVGYSIRFEDVTSSSTRIKFLTDGLLIREALVDPLLSRYSVIMVDEAHERSISTDILLGLLKKIMRKRPELRLIISSATLQADAFLKYFTPAPDSGAPEPQIPESPATVVNIEGRAFPIDILYLEEPTEDYFERAITTVLDIHTKEADGDILVFLTGREEIDRAVQAVADRLLEMGPQERTLEPLPLYAGLSTEQQMFIFDKPPENKRKVVFSTNIAEASVTIDGIVYVVDCGFVKLRTYDPDLGIDSLTTTPLSKASAMQRAGRAGRTRAGKCFRLYTEETWESLADANVPEIQRTNLAPFILQLKALGIDNILRFPFLSAPPAKLMAKALELLYSLGALDEYAKLTRPLGYRMAEIAVEPMMGKTLLSAQSFGCLSEILTIAAMTSVAGNVWFYHDGERKRMESSRRKFAVEEGDHLTLLNVYLAFITKGKKEARFCHDHNLNFKTMTKAVSVRAQLKRYIERFGIPVDESLGTKLTQQDMLKKAEQIRRCLTSGYFAHAARMRPDGTFQKVAGDMTLHAHPTSLLFSRKADWVIYHEIIETSSKVYIRDITKIERNWLLEYAPDFYKISKPADRV